jgi:hypothetical protein
LAANRIGAFCFGIFKLSIAAGLAETVVLEKFSPGNPGNHEAARKTPKYGPGACSSARFRLAIKYTILYKKELYIIKQQNIELYIIK